MPKEKPDATAKPATTNGLPGATPHSFWGVRLPGLPVTAWDIANGGVKIGLTSIPLAVLTSVQAELQASHQQGRRLPPGRLAVFRTLYPSFAGHCSRGACSMTGKEYQKEQGGPKEARRRQNQALTFGGFVTADFLAAKYTSTWVKLVAGEAVPPTFRSPTRPTALYNLFQVFKVGAPLDLLTGGISLGMLFYGADHFSNHVWKTQSPLFNNLAGGATAGLITAGMTGGIKGAYDAQVQRTQIGKDGRLQTVGTFRFFKSLYNSAIEMGPKELVVTVVKRVASDTAHAGIRTAGIFAIIQASLWTLGQYPLAQIVPKPQAVEPSIVEIKDEEAQGAQAKGPK